MEGGGIDQNALEVIIKQLSSLAGDNPVAHQPGRSPLATEGRNVVVMAGECANNFVGCDQNALSTFGLICPIKEGIPTMVKPNGDICVPSKSYAWVQKKMRNIREEVNMASMRIQELINWAKDQGLNQVLEALVKANERRQNMDDTYTSSAQVNALRGELNAMAGGSLTDGYRAILSQSGDLRARMSAMSGGAQEED